MFSAEADGFACTLGGGAHHAFPSHGRGYCIFNDIAVAALQYLQSNSSGKVVVLDCDVHQGDGTAVCLSEHPQTRTVSIHGESNYPFRKSKSDYDISLSPACGDTAYLSAVASALSYLLDFKPTLVCYIAGADPFIEDRLGSLKVSGAALRTRDELVLHALYENEIPCALFFGGGYCDPIATTVAINLQTIEIAAGVYGFAAKHIRQLS